jgi:Na+/melibiose symporter-like transporter
MFAAILPYVIGIAAVFAPPVGMTQLQILAWLIGTGLLARCGISFWTVPAYALDGELSVNQNERRLIAVLRNLGNQLSLYLATYCWQLDQTWTPRLLIAGVVGHHLASP